MEQVLDGLLLCAVAVDEVFRRSAEDNLSGDADGGIFLEADGGFLLIPVVEDDGDAGFRYAGLTALVYQVLLGAPVSFIVVREQSSTRGPVRTCRFCARTVDMFVIPRTKQMASRMLDFPLPLRPVMELKLSSLRYISPGHAPAERGIVYLPS